jgi:pSer/pThr/pTyr-binding forkhead associated (FHA) protein
MKERQFIRVGRGHDADIRVTDISVSRFHAKINRSEDGQFYVEDNKSKFGTLIQARKPIMLDKNQNNYIQMGRSTL